MGKKIPRITNSEMQILEVLWDEGEALTSSEIVEVSDDRTWKSSSVHLLLNSLLIFSDPPHSMVSEVHSTSLLSSLPVRLFLRTATPPSPGSHRQPTAVRTD